MKVAGIVLIVIIGLFNFHIPHSFIEDNNLSGASKVVELIFVVNLLGALAAAVGIYFDQRWGWILGICIAVLSALLWILQETVGLSGLPQQWLEPSRIVSLIIEIVFVLLARSIITTHE